MKTVFEKYLDDLLTDTTYGFIIVEDIRDVRDENAENTDTPFQPDCKFIDFNKEDGSLLVLSEEEALFLYLAFPAFNSAMIGLGKDASVLHICQRWNNSQHKRAVMELSKWKQKNVSFESNKRIRYFSDVIGIFDAWYYENGLDSSVKTPIGFKPPQAKPGDINFDKIINGYIECYLKFFSIKENKNRELYHKEVAKFTGTSESAISRMFNKYKLKFLPRFITILEEMRNDNLQKQTDEKPLTNDQKNILLQLQDEIQFEKRKLNKRKEDFKSTPEKVGRAGNLNTDQIQTEKTRSDKASSKAVYGNSIEATLSALDGETVIDRQCNNCKKPYPAKVVEDSDIKHWEKEAKENPEFYEFLTCSPECWDILVEKNKVVKPTNKSTSSNKKSTKETDAERKERIIKEFTTKQQNTKN